MLSLMGTQIIKNIGLNLRSVVIRIIFHFYLNSGGIPFNPLTFKDCKNRKVGGFGILLVKAFMDKISYQYKNGCNCITLIKKMNF